MKKNQSSRSAEGVAALRAIESQKPESKRICYDPFADMLIPHSISFSISKFIITSGMYERMVPGAMAFVTGRERYIDDFLKTCLNEGLDQVVILGAGFDTRAYRIEGIGKTRVFEIDHPSTQEVKLARLKKAINSLPDYVIFIPVDFNTQELGERLLSSGFDEQGKTLFIWQGVTYFLTPEGVDGTLSFIANHSGPGSSVIFDYFYNETLHDTSNRYVKMMHRASKMTGEAYIFGIDQGQTKPFLEQRGFNDIQDVRLEDIKRMYFTGPNAERIMPAGIAIVSAKVKKA